MYPSSLVSNCDIHVATLSIQGSGLCIPEAPSGGNLFLFFQTVALAGVACNRYGSRPTWMVGGFMIFLVLLLSFWASKLYQMYIIGAVLGKFFINSVFITTVTRSDENNKASFTTAWLVIKPQKAFVVVWRFLCTRGSTYKWRHFFNDDLLHRCRCFLKLFGGHSGCSAVL